MVTINLNNKDGLKETMDSVFNQTCFNNIDYVIIDGGSTDGSRELIEQHADKLHYWVSEPDGGIFNAFNKAIPHCNGDYTLFLNSGDKFHQNDVVENAVPKLVRDICYGNELKVGRRTYIARFPDRLDEHFFKTSALPHQSLFLSTSYLKEHPFSTEWKILGDWKQTREAIMVDKVSYKHLNFIISDYDLNGVSSINQNLFREEKTKYYEKINK